MSETVTVTNPKSGKLSKPGYYPIIDALRFILAFWVAVGHYEMIPLFGDSTTGTGLWFLFKRAWNTVVFGPPAVIVFFVISGFCIHLPFRGTAKMDIARYYLRRYTRILIPVAGALAIYRLLGQRLIAWGEHSILWESPLWSLACEEIYYALYPVLRWSRNRIGWAFLLPASFVIAIAITVSHRHAVNFHVFGPFGTAMMLLPVWLLGCLLAEQSDSLPVGKPVLSIWFWRFLAWFGCWASEMLHFKLGVPFTQTLLWFGVLAYFWLRQEIGHGKTHSPNRILVTAGAWSYSLYLMHAQGGEIFGFLQLPSLGHLLNWCLVMTSSLLFSYLFYILVERPSHRLARKIKVKGAAGSAVSQGEIRNISPEGVLPEETASI